MLRIAVVVSIGSRTAVPRAWTILDKNLGPDARNWYAAAAVEYGWSKDVLMNMIMNKSMVRTGAAPSNFTRNLPAGDSELAQQTAKDPYAFEFLGLSGRGTTSPAAADELAAAFDEIASESAE